ncbi:MAG: adenylate/guanylate cyclase domain-containing protein [Stellaceae bacterium]
MTEPTRRLAAILAADMAGYSRLADADEDRTLARLRALRGDLIDPAIAAHRGHVIKRAGDGAIVEFRSVIDALNCAIEVQTGMVERNVGVSASRQIQFRIGIHIGDVVGEADGDLMGNGVNIAARLEAICEPGDICLSGAAHEHVRDKVSTEFVDLGEQQLKNIGRPVRTYGLRIRATAQTTETSTPRLALPDKPSIAVLPFQNMSGDPEQDYFCDGMVEDIVTGLSRINWLFVIARNSSFVYKGRSVDVKQVGRELGVRYVLEGSVRKGGNRLRITCQLIEAETGAHVWADRYDGALEEVFDLQDRITETVVGVIEPNVRRVEIERARRKRPESLDAYDLYLRALPLSVSLIPADARGAIALLEQSLSLDATYAPAHALLAWCHEICYLHEGFNPSDKAACIQHARAAIEGGTDDSATLAIAGIALLILAHDRETSLGAVDRALQLNDSCATALYFGAQVHAWSGNADIATDLATRAQRLSPFDLWSYIAHQAKGISALYEGSYAEAAAHFASGIQANPRFVSLYAWRGAALALAGQLDEGKLIAQRLLELEPHFRCRLASEIGLIPVIAERFYQGLRDLGIPE